MNTQHTDEVIIEPEIAKKIAAILELGDKEHLRRKFTRTTVFVGAGTCGLASGAGKSLESLKKKLDEEKIEADIIEVGCVGYCEVEPIFDVKMPGLPRVSFYKVTPDVAVELVEKFIKNHDTSGLPVLGQYTENGVSPIAGIPNINEIPFFKKQVKIVLENCGVVEPTNIDEYISRGGFSSLYGILKTYSPKQVVDEMITSGLRGRGGGGFPTGKKWLFAFSQDNPQKFIVCNADEGDPGAFMDRSVLEGDPYRVLEGMMIGGFAIGANTGIIYARAEYPLAIEHLQTAIREMKRAGLLGKNILGTGFGFTVKIKKGAGAFVCGEETALMASIEGKRGSPRFKPPYPTTSGLYESPTIINNVETFANVPAIFRNGAENFANIGTAGSKGTKVFALSGKLKNNGLVEVPMGITLREIIFDVGGGILNDKKFKAVQIGGPSGGCIPEEYLDTPIDYESLKTVGAMMGSGGLVVMDEDSCMVDIARYFMDFIQKESCGKCIPCREGTKRLFETLERITKSAKVMTEQERLERFNSIIYMERLARTIKDTALCGLGMSSANPIISTLKYFREEYEQHIYTNHCPAGQCSGMTEYKIIASRCKGCTLCKRRCPNNAIVGEVKHPHYIIADKCIGCGMCIESCKFGAIEKVKEGVPCEN